MFKGIKNSKWFLTQILKKGPKKKVPADACRWIQILCKAFIVQVIFFSVQRFLHASDTAGLKEKGIRVGNLWGEEKRQVINLFVGSSTDRIVQDEPDALHFFKEMQYSMAIPFVAKVLVRCSMPKDTNEKDEKNWYGKGCRAKATIVIKKETRKGSGNVKTSADVTNLLERVERIEEWQNRIKPVLQTVMRAEKEIT